MQPFRVSAVVCLVLFVATVPGSAGVIYDNGGNPAACCGNVRMSYGVEADDFTLTAGNTITDIYFWDLGTPVTPFLGFSWAVYSDASGLPGSTVLASGLSSADTMNATGIVHNGFPEYFNDLSIDPVALSAGTYWLSLHYGPLSHVAFDPLYWEGTLPNSTSSAAFYQPADSAPSWSSLPNFQFAFQLENSSSNSAPEPGSGLMMCMGVFFLGLICILGRPRLSGRVRNS